MRAAAAAAVPASSCTAPAVTTPPPVDSTQLPTAAAQRMRVRRRALACGTAANRGGTERREKAGGGDGTCVCVSVCVHVRVRVCVRSKAALCLFELLRQGRHAQVHTAVLGHGPVLHVDVNGQPPRHQADTRIDTPKQANVCPSEELKHKQTAIPTGSKPSRVVSNPNTHTETETQPDTHRHTDTYLDRVGLQ